MKALVLMMYLVMAGTVWSYATFDEAYDAGNLKFKSANNAGALVDFTAAVPLAMGDYQVGKVHYYLGAVHRVLLHSVEARAEYGIVLAGADQAHWQSAKFDLAAMLISEGNYPGAKTMLLEGIALAGVDKNKIQLYELLAQVCDTLGQPSEALTALVNGLKVPGLLSYEFSQKEAIWKKLVARKPVWSEAAVVLSGVNDWSVLLFKAGAQALAKNYAGAAATLDEAAQPLAFDISEEGQKIKQLLLAARASSWFQGTDQSFKDWLSSQP